MVKTLFIYAGVDRKELEKKIAQGISPDTSFFGFKAVAKNPLIEAEYLQLGKSTYGWGGNFFRRFALTRSLYVLVKFYQKLSSYDVLVITSSAYFFILFFKKIGLLRCQRLVLLNLDLSVRLNKLNHALWQRKFLISVLREANGIVCISEAQTNDLLALGLDQTKITFIPMGVDKSFYRPVDSSGETVLTIGRDVGRDIKNFLEAIKLSSEKAVMICSPHNIQGLEALIPENLTILFDQPYEVLKSYYAKAKAFVIAT